jgi:hypothetical protein
MKTYTVDPEKGILMNYFQNVPPSLSQKYIFKQVLGAHACNPGYSGGRDQEIAVQSQPKARL